jgi:predicted RNA-binding protein with PUA-like domain
MSYWIFKCDPKKYRLSDRLQQQTEPTITWLVTRYKKEIAAGDTVFLMESGPKRAIRAVMQVDSAPAEMAELSHEQEFWKERDTELRCRVLGTLTDRVNLPIEEIKTVAELRDLLLCRKPAFSMDC